jgi:hypothetical protein
MRSLTFLYVETLAFKQTPGRDDIGELIYLRAIEVWQKCPAPFILKLQQVRKLRKAASRNG